jgi:hypothetical protein
MIQTSNRPAARRAQKAEAAGKIFEGSAFAARKRHKLARQGKPRRRKASAAEVRSPVPEPEDKQTRAERKAQLRAWANAREVERQTEESERLSRLASMPIGAFHSRFGCPALPQRST